MQVSAENYGIKNLFSWSQKDVERIERNLKKFALPERNTKLVLENEEQDVWDTR